MSETNPYSQPRSPLSQPHGEQPSRAPRTGAIVGSSLLIPAYLALFVMGRDPNGDGPWGWCLGSVLSGVGFGAFFGVTIGGGIGWIVQGAQWLLSPSQAGHERR